MAEASSVNALRARFEAKKGGEEEETREEKDDERRGRGRGRGATRARPASMYSSVGRTTEMKNLLDEQVLVIVISSHHTSSN
jgi:hypothetical protein